MTDLAQACRGEGEDRARQNRRILTGRQTPGEPPHPDGGQRERRDEGDVVRDERAAGQPHNRGDRHADPEQVLGKRQRVCDTGRRSGRSTVRPGRGEDGRRPIRESTCSAADRRDRPAGLRPGGAPAARSPTSSAGGNPQQSRTVPVASSAGTDGSPKSAYTLNKRQRGWIHMQWTGRLRSVGAAVMVTAVIAAWLLVDSEFLDAAFARNRPDGHMARQLRGADRHVGNGVDADAVGHVGDGSGARAAPQRRRAPQRVPDRHAERLSR